MDYSEVNAKHYKTVKAFHVDPEGRALIILRDGGGMKVDSPEEADKELAKYEELKGKAK